MCLNMTKIGNNECRVVEHDQKWLNFTKNQKILNRFFVVVIFIFRHIHADRFVIVAIFIGLTITHYVYDVSAVQLEMERKT